MNHEPDSTLAVTKPCPKDGVHLCPYPPLALFGEQGSFKTFTARLLRGLVDPHVTPLRGPVRDERDLMIAASHTHIVGFDNLSRLPDWLSDGLCRIATGGGFATRALFTDDDEHIIDVMRPVILTAISAVIHRGDLLDRASVVTLPTRVELRRRPEADLLQEYESLRPAHLGELLRVASAALRDSGTVSTTVMPHMADHCLWVTAAEDSLGWPAGTYIAAYSRQQHEAVEVQLDGDAVVQALRKLMKNRDKWEGTSTELLETLVPYAPDTSREAGWPRAARGLSVRLERLAPDLRRTGLDVSRHHDGTRRVVVLRSVTSVPSVRTPTDEGPATNASTNARRPTEGAALDQEAHFVGPPNVGNALNATDRLLAGSVEPGTEEEDDDSITL